MIENLWYHFLMFLDFLETTTFYYTGSILWP